MKTFLESPLNLTSIGSYQNIYEDVYIDTKTSVVLDNDLNPIYETLYEAIYWWKGTLKGELWSNQELRKQEVSRRYSEIMNVASEITKHDVEAALIIDSNHETLYAMSSHGWYPYGHLHDSLLRLYSWKDCNFKDPKILCSNYKRVVDFELHIQAFGYGADSIIEASNDKRLIKVSKLYFGVNQAFFWTKITPPQYEWMIAGYKHIVEKLEFGREQINGLYLSRNHIGKRGVVNDDEVKEFLIEKFGFKVLEGNETLPEIISLFSRAKFVVGPHGSIFVNTIFCGENCRIFEFCPSNRPDFSFKNKFKLAKSYNHILVDADREFNIEIDLNFLADVLA